MQLGNIDYSQVQLSLTCYRKHLLKDVTYFLVVTPNYVYLSTEPQSQNPKYTFQLAIENKIHWTVQKDRKLAQFGFDYKGQTKYFDAKHEDIKQLKVILKNRILYKEVSDFYQPLKLIGKGGSSKVYLVIDKDSKLEWASKCVDKKQLKDDGGFSALINEIQLMLQIEHEAIVQVEEIYEGDNTFYIIMEYLRGCSLHEMTSRRIINGLQWDQIKIILWQILSVIAKMHSKGIMHRDLKPENIMFKDPNSLQTLKVVDFGLATQTKLDVYPFPKCGTPGYVAPEIANLKDLKLKYDCVCDVFSIGCIFYKLITMQDLFPGTDYHEILKLNKKCQISLDDLSMYRTPATALDLIKQMLKSNPNERITAQQALDHPFFQNGLMSDKKLKFQMQKKNEPQSKLWQTQNFTPQKFNYGQFDAQDKDQQYAVEDENVKIIVPVMKNVRLAEHIEQKNLDCIEQKKKNGFKKSMSTEFDPYLLSPDRIKTMSGQHHPTLINVNGLSQADKLSKYQKDIIHELEDEQKNM